VDERRSDWAEAHKVEIKKEIGMDPNAEEWEFEELELSDNDD
jgi:hypothetical protein